MIKVYSFPDDWSAHTLSPISDTNLLYMADAAAQAASILTYPWDAGDRLSAAGVDPAPLLVPADVAFDDHAMPVPEIHALQGGMVWAYSQLGTLDPSITHAPSMRISYDDWDDAFIESSYTNQFRKACREVATIVADVLTLAAASKAIKTYVRPVGGGRPMIDPPDHAWEIDDRLTRLARCGLVYDSPGDTSSPADHLIYFDPQGFDDVIRSYLPMYWRPLLGELSDLPPPGEPTITEQRNALVRAMVEAVGKARDKRWTRSALTEALNAAGLKPRSSNMFEEARRIVLEKTKIETPFGRPPTGQMPIVALQKDEETSG